MQQPLLKDLSLLTVEIVRWLVGEGSEFVVLLRRQFFRSGSSSTAVVVGPRFDTLHIGYTMRAAICGGRPAAWTRKRRPRRCAIDTYNGWRCAETPVYLATQGLYTATHAAGAYVTVHVLTWPSPESGVVCWVDKLRSTRLNSWSLETADLE